MNTARSARARAQVVSALEAAHLFRSVEAATAPIRLPLARRNLRRFYDQFVAAGDLVFDIGANVGEHSTVFLSLGARVVSVEPQTLCVEKLLHRFGDRITVVPKAVAGDAGERKLLLNTISSERATLSQEHVDEGRFRRGWEGCVVVEVTTLDALIGDHGLPALCKIDVEALEPQVLRGLGQPIAVVVFEFHEGFPGTLECLRLLGRLGPYEFNFRIGRSPLLAGSDWVSGEIMYSRLSQIDTPIYGDVVARLQCVGVGRRPSLRRSRP